MVGSTAQQLLAGCTGAELFSNSHQRLSVNGILEHSILFTANRMEVSPMARWLGPHQGGTMEPRITAETTVLAWFTSYLLDLSANGTKGYFIASKREWTAIARSAMLF